jgi:hypothetical protein
MRRSSSVRVERDTGHPQGRALIAAPCTPASLARHPGSSGCVEQASSSRPDRPLAVVLAARLRARRLRGQREAGYSLIFPKAAA